MDKSSLPHWLQSKVAELEAQIGRPMTGADLACVDIDDEGRTMTVARSPLLMEIRAKERGRTRDQDLPPNP